MDPGDLLTVFFTIVIIGMSVGQGMELVPEMMKARFASAEIFYGIYRVFHSRFGTNCTRSHRSRAPD
jgi:hypothetical protein